MELLGQAGERKERGAKGRMHVRVGVCTAVGAVCVTVCRRRGGGDDGIYLRNF